MKKLFPLLFLSLLGLAELSWTQTKGYVLNKEGQKLEGKIKIPAYGNSVILCDAQKNKIRFSPSSAMGFVLREPGSDSFRQFEAIRAPNFILPNRVRSQGEHLCFAEKIYEGQYKLYKKEIYITIDRPVPTINTFYFLGREKEKLEVYNFLGFVTRMSEIARLCPNIAPYLEGASENDVINIVRQYEKCWEDHQLQ